MLVKAFLLGSLVMPRKNGKKVKPEGGKPTQENKGTHLSLSLMPHDSGSESRFRGDHNLQGSSMDSAQA